MCCGLNSGHCSQPSLAGAKCHILNPPICQELLFTLLPPYLQLVVVRADLNGHLRALKDYILLDKGDFFQVKNGQQFNYAYYILVTWSCHIMELPFMLSYFTDLAKMPMTVQHFFFFWVVTAHTWEQRKW